MNQNTENNVALNKRPVTWSALFIRVIVIYIIFAFLSHLYFPAPTYNLPESKILLFLPIAYLINFLAIFVPVVIVTILIAKVPSRNRDKPLQNFINNSLIVTIMISALFIYGGYNSIQLSQHRQSDPTKEKTNHIKPVVVATTSQDSEGFSENSLDNEALAKLEAWMVNLVMRKGKAQYESLGLPSDGYSPQINHQATYVAVQGKKLAVVKISIENSARSVAIIGFKGSELIRINCLRASNHEIPVFSGACGEEVSKVFNVRVNPDNT